ncbi:hypothetical protein [Helicobacter suis]|uniref:Uncharacterized protein n=1 Tax=Helicobacter suis TaxID=104628 RepID=A0A6J4D0G9_9HELI|nr:hypothetical protein [Helicobacter suis]BCD45617.1 hypothetical protein NHP190020_06560 [Helicobacter suis]BCD47316.1 hypothetical protein NHP194003_05200 [Helicobacter suis]BCD49070.1 hypothetical protein NHP194004_05170 [Helicobacter suis]BCD50816.1 hypothetical protein NHP194022_04870 [Helicobacter suis]BCD70473.1 hypothetical protein SNTW_11180 [Helicobacter suis]
MWCSKGGQANAKKVEIYIRKEMADFDITKPRFTFEEKYRPVSFINQCHTEIAPLDLYLRL